MTLTGGAGRIRIGAGWIWIGGTGCTGRPMRGGYGLPPYGMPYGLTISTSLIRSPSGKRLGSTTWSTRSAIGAPSLAISTCATGPYAFPAPLPIR